MRECTETDRDLSWRLDQSVVIGKRLHSGRHYCAQLFPCVEEFILSKLPGGDQHQMTKNTSLPEHDVKLQVILWDNVQCHRHRLFADLADFNLSDG